MSKYINPYTDFGFKKLFGEEGNKDLLIDFLNQLLPTHHQIETLTFRNNENSSEFAFERKAVFDIHCHAQNGERFIVEMQKAKVNYFKDRSLFYTTFPIREQAKRGEAWDFRLTPVYMIAILDFLYDEEAEKQKFLRSVALKDQDGEIFYDKLHFKFIQMPLFNKGENELKTHFDKWIYFLKNLDSFNDIPLILKEPIFEKAFHEAEIAAMTAPQFEQYQESLMSYIEIREVINTAIQSAENDGRKKEKYNIAKEMKKDGEPLDKIMRYTGLSEKEINGL
ncbi:putative transposase/invertase (TIGR01784 family) [Arcicella aurantiaca]|jgi:predicted transposase/invertase (TIGR01784 family)|uniref:Putative transposase/invertase (TIGR01784 family) n=1 Tax=Arcicella aurantiaca TaxID=591202 RepID=A0A316E8E6_9BACT|nr:Rpn family recombination-promoting nuclease/putative transposase [Arcicella aurantiaca]PWK26346.1 putative transposase/invertase (TIGR01784 family) [Arcicella aurantiaca]